PAPFPRVQPRRARVGSCAQHELERALLDEERLVLHAVVLQAQLVARADEQDLPAVTLGRGEAELVTPRLVDAHHSSVPSPSRISAATPLALARSHAARASSRAAGTRVRRTACATAASVRGSIENSRSPRPIRSGTSRGSAAISPHSPTGTPAATARSTTNRI